MKQRDEIPCDLRMDLGESADIEGAVFAPSESVMVVGRSSGRRGDRRSFQATKRLPISVPGERRMAIFCSKRQKSFLYQFQVKGG